MTQTSGTNETPAGGAPAASTEGGAGRARVARTGLVVSTGGDKTVHVRVETLVRHRRYGKYLRRRSKLAVHDPRGQGQLGDLVEIVPCRRQSKTKAWRLTRVLRAATISTRAAAQEKG
jgi:small subunit ribosomal protein S17